MTNPRNLGEINIQIGSVTFRDCRVCFLLSKLLFYVTNRVDSFVAVLF